MRKRCSKFCWLKKFLPNFPGINFKKIIPFCPVGKFLLFLLFFKIHSQRLALDFSHEYRSLLRRNWLRSLILIIFINFSLVLSLSYKKDCEFWKCRQNFVFKCREHYSGLLKRFIMREINLTKSKRHYSWACGLFFLSFLVPSTSNKSLRAFERSWLFPGSFFFRVHIRFFLRFFFFFLKCLARMMARFSGTEREELRWEIVRGFLGDVPVEDAASSILIVRKAASLRREHTASPCSGTCCDRYRRSYLPLSHRNFLRSENFKWITWAIWRINNLATVIERKFMSIW